MSEKVQNAEVEKKPRVKKELTAEDIKAIVAAADVIEAMGVSAEFANLLALARKWNGTDEETLAAAKAACIEAMGGSAVLKDYIDGGFAADVEALAGMTKLASTLNSIRSFYARRKAVKRIKYVNVNIKTENGPEIFKVNVEALNEAKKIASQDERREYLLNHPDTIKDSVESF